MLKSSYMKRQFESGCESVAAMSHNGSFLTAPVTNPQKGFFRQTSPRRVTDSEGGLMSPRGQAGSAAGVKTPRLNNNANGAAMLAPTAIKKTRRITIVKGGDQEGADKTRTTYTIGTASANQNIQSLDDKRR